MNVYGTIMISLSLRTKVLNEYLCYSRVLEFIIETLKFIENVVENLNGEESCSIFCI